MDDPHERERSRGGSLTVNRFDRCSETVTDESSTYGAESTVAGNSNSSISNSDAAADEVDKRPPNGNSRKKKHGPQSDPLTFEELGKVYANISRREVVGKVSSGKNFSLLFKGRGRSAFCPYFSPNFIYPTWVLGFHRILFLILEIRQRSSTEFLS